MRLLATVLAGILMMTSVALGEIEKIAVPQERGLTLIAWPKVSPVPGWHQDGEASVQLGVNAFVPDGSTFATAETVMYAKAISKPPAPGHRSLAAFIEADRKEFLAHSPGTVVKAVAPVRTADGTQLKSFTFFPASTGNWERVAYGEEGEYYLVFAVSARSLRGYEACLKSFEQMVGGYK